MDVSGKTELKIVVKRTVIKFSFILFLKGTERGNRRRERIRWIGIIFCINEGNDHEK